MARKPDEETTLTLADVEAWFSQHPITGKRNIIEKLQAALDAAVEARRQELLAELGELGPTQQRNPKPKAEKAEGDKRAVVKPMYRAPDGFEWSGRGAIPKVFKALGVTDKAGMEQFRIAE